MDHVNAANRIIILFRLLSITVLLVAQPIRINVCNAEVFGSRYRHDPKFDGGGIRHRLSKRARIIPGSINAVKNVSVPSSSLGIEATVARLPRGGGGSGTGVPTVPSSTVDTTVSASPASPLATHDSSDGSNGNGNGIENESDRWRDDLPEQLQKRRGALHRLIVPTGFTRQQQQQYSTGDGNDAGININCSYDDKEDIHCQVYLLGTAHVSKDSCADAKILMECIKPDVLFVELCSQRTSLLEQPERATPDQDTEAAAAADDRRSIREMYRTALQSDPNLTRTAALSSVLLSKIQGDYATKLGVSIGGEFREAFGVARAQQRLFRDELQMSQQRLDWENMYGVDVVVGERWGVGGGGRIEDMNGCTVVLGDRPVQLTLSRAYESLSIIGRIKLVLGLFWSSLRQPDMDELKEWLDLVMNDPNGDVLSQSIEELSRHFPTIRETIINERDTYMACKLLQTASILGASTAEDGRPRTIVAVVGAGHCPGIIERLTRVREKPDTRVDVIDSLKDIVETKKYKVAESDELKFLVDEVASLSL